MNDDSNDPFRARIDMINKKTIIAHNQRMERHYRRIREYIEAVGSKAWEDSSMSGDITITKIDRPN